MPTIRYTDIVCGFCGSNDVRRDANATWDKYTSRWELSAVFDNATCETCGGETRLSEVEVEEETL